MHEDARVYVVVRPSMGVEWSGVEWEWSGVEWSGVGVEWSGVEWSGVEWKRRNLFVIPHRKNPCVIIHKRNPFVIRFFALPAAPGGARKIWETKNEKKTYVFTWKKMKKLRLRGRGGGKKEKLERQ